MKVIRWGTGVSHGTGSCDVRSFVIDKNEVIQHEVLTLFGLQPAVSSLKSSSKENV